MGRGTHGLLDWNLYAPFPWTPGCFGDESRVVEKPAPPSPDRDLLRHSPCVAGDLRGFKGFQVPWVGTARKTALWTSSGVGFRRQRPKIANSWPFPRISPSFVRSGSDQLRWCVMLRLGSSAPTYISDNFPYPPITSGMSATQLSSQSSSSIRLFPTYSAVLPLFTQSPQTTGWRCPCVDAPGAAP